jgi:hypothetical protein
MRNTLAECRRCWCPRRRRDRGAAPLHARGHGMAASAVPLPNGFLTASLASPGLEARARRLEQLTTMLLNRETISGSRKQHS